MARKRLTKVPSPAVSSSEEEGEGSSTEEEEEEHQNGTVPAQNGTIEKQNDDEDGSEDDDDKEDDEEEDDDDDEEEKEETEKPNQPLSKPSKPDSESDSETESDKTGSTEPTAPSLPDFTMKPISPKRKAGKKLELPKEKDGGDKSGNRGAGAGGRRPQRLWSEEDEITILNGIVEYQNEKGKNFFDNYADFHGSLKESLHHAEATINQFVDKIRRLKKKYFTGVDKNENDIGKIFSKQHDLECGELAQKIWGAGGIEVGRKASSSKRNTKNVNGGGGGEASSSKRNIKNVSVSGGGGGGGEASSSKRNTKNVSGGGGGEASSSKRNTKNVSCGGGSGKASSSKKNTKNVSGGGGGSVGGGIIEEAKGGKGKLSVKKRAADEELSGEEDEVNVAVKKQKTLVNEEEDGEEGIEDLWKKYPYLRSSLDSECFPEGMKESTMSRLEMVREKKLVELEREWQGIMKVELELFVKERDLIGKQIKLSLDAMKSQDS